jgi:hypothetical protein
MPELSILGAKEENRYYPYQQAFRVTRKSFWQAGQDSFTQPPAQNPDMFQALTNVEPVLQGNLQRRRGYTQFSNTTPTIPFHNGYAFRSEILNLRRLVWTSSSTVVAVDENGSTISSPLFTPSMSAKAVRMVLSRSYGYFADGIAADYLKWDGTTSTGNLTNWGIAVSAAAGSVNGPNPPGTAASVSTQVGQSPWATPNNIKVADGAFATTTPITFPRGSAAQSASERLEATNFGFAVTPNTSQVTGIQLDVKGLQSQQTASPNTASITAYLIINGSVVGPGKTLVLPLTNNFIQFGGPSDSWGHALTGVDVNASNFGVSIQAQSIDDDGHLIGNVTYSIDFVQMTVFVSGSTIILGAPGVGGITLLSGRIYTVAFTNSLAGTVSTTVPFSSSTGPLTLNDQPLSGLPVSTDPQVDQKFLLATADGGDETTLYLITEIPNAQTTYVDNMSDTQLLLQPIFQDTDVNGNLHGVVNNLPPPLIDFPTKHKGRIFGTIGSTLHYSKNLDDVTTSTGTITSKWEEDWPAVNILDISELAETVTGLLSDGQTLYIGTDHAVRRLIGDSPDNFQQPEVLFNETGVVNQEVWQIVFMEGQPVGSMWLTPDNRAMFSDFNSYQDIGTPIQDVLNSINTNVASTVAHACFVSEGPSEYFMLYIPTGSNMFADTVCVYNLRTKHWVIWKPSDIVTASLFNITAVGTPQWLFATEIGPLFIWDKSVRVDRFKGAALQYPVPITTSWLDFGDEGLTKAFNKIIVTTADPNLLVSVQGAIRDSDLDTGGILVMPPTPLQAEIFGELFIPDMVSLTGKYKWYQITFTSPASTVVDVLDGLDFEIMPSMRM